MKTLELLIPTYIQYLKALSAWLEKADKASADGNALLSARLAPDMLPLSTQVRFCCVQAYEGVSRLCGKDFPDVWQTLLDEGANGGDQPGTMDDAQSRIGDALAFLKLYAELESNEAAATAVEIELPNGMIFDMTTEQYARDWALPQFYFHIMTAYSLLRNAGIDLGKADYVQHIFAYKRP